MYMTVEVQVVKQVFKNDETPVTFDERGRPIFTARSLSSDFLPIKWLQEAAEDSPGKPVLYRHRDPNDPKHADEPIYGRVMESKVVEQEGKNFIVSKYMLFNTTERQKELGEAVKLRYEEKNPLGISMGYHLYKIKETQEIIGTNVLEHSVTWKPQCKLCVMLEDTSMPEDETKTKEQKDKTSAEILEDLDEKRIKMEDLQDEVAKKAKEVESLKRESKDRNSVIEAQKQTLEKLTKDMAEMAKSVHSLEAERDYLQKKPLIDEIVHLEASDEMLRDFYKTKEQKFLEDRIKVLKARPAPEAKIAETASETRKQEDKPDEEKIKGGLRSFLAEQGLRQEIIDQVVGK